MNYYYILPVFLVFLLLITRTFGRALSYDELDQDDNTKLFSNEDEEGQDLKSELSNVLNEYNNNDDDNDNNALFDSYEERQFHHRSLFSSSRAPHTISAHTRQALIDILQKAFDQGWRPNLKHYVPSTRFGRHRR